LIEISGKEVLSIFEEQFIVQQLMEKLRDYFKLSKESLSFVMEMWIYGG